MTHIIDGGLSTELERLGASFDGPLWTGRTLLDNPQLIERAHRNFVDAGAEVVITASYQLSRRGFLEIGLTANDADSALRLSVDTARNAVRGTKALVAASIGPYGATLHDGSEYRGNYGLTEDELFVFHAERIAVLEAAQPDILLAETIPDLVETRALARALANTALPVWVSFTAGDANHLWSGASVEDAVRTVSSIPTVQTIGFNCVKPELVSGLVSRARSVTDVSLAVYPNKGGSWDASAGEWSDQNNRTLSDYWSDWSALGIDYVGGCCGVDALDLRELAARVS